MADITASATGNPVVESLPEHQLTLKAAVAITALQLIYVNSDGKWALADADDAAKLKLCHIATRTVTAGESLTGASVGTVDGYDLDELEYGDILVASGTAGALQDAAGSGQTELVIGVVVPVTGNSIGAAANKLFQFNIPQYVAA